MATPEARAKGQNPAYKPAHRHHHSDQDSDLRADLLGHGWDTRGPEHTAYFIRSVGDVVLERSDDFAFNQDLTTLRAKWRVDGDLLDYGVGVTMVRNV